MRMRPSLKLLALAGLVSSLVLSLPAAESQADDWYCDLSIYGLGAAMSCDITIGSATAEASLPFDKVLESLEVCARGSPHVGRGDRALATDLVYRGPGAARIGITIEMDQLVFEPTLSRVGYRRVTGFMLCRLAGDEPRRAEPSHRRGPGPLHRWVRPVARQSMRWYEVNG